VLTEGIVGVHYPQYECRPFLDIKKGENTERNLKRLTHLQYQDHSAYGGKLGAFFQRPVWCYSPFGKECIAGELLYVPVKVEYSSDKTFQEGV
jgi:hypothetical protein